ncbi:MAG: PIN domain-containing protein [Solirubrobacterales bacterium]
MIAPDSSVLIAGADPEHPFSRQATAALVEVRDRGRIVAHTLAETYAVLSSTAYERAPIRVAEYLSQFLDRAPVGVTPERYPEAIMGLARSGIGGAAVYDGLIALGARDAGIGLVSLDRRASTTYRLCGVEFRLLDA